MQSVVSRPMVKRDMRFSSMSWKNQLRLCVADLGSITGDNRRARFLYTPHGVPDWSYRTILGGLFALLSPAQGQRLALRVLGSLGGSRSA